jgi:hypothetical protein
MHLPFALLLALCLLPAIPAAAQDAVLTCNVIDSSGAPVPGATVTLRNVATAVATESFSNYGSFDAFVREGLKLSATEVASIRNRLLQ